MIEIRYPSEYSVQEWEDLGYVLVTLAAGEIVTRIMFMSHQRLVGEVESCLNENGRWEERNCVVVEPFVYATVAEFLERARSSGFARFW